MKTQNESEQYAGLTQELRRGALPLAVLSMLKESKYGYALINDLESFGIEIDQGTLYPMLRRLESQGLLQSSWIIDGSRPRRYYEITNEGRDVLKILSSDWMNLNRVMENVLGEKPIINGEKNETN